MANLLLDTDAIKQSIAKRWNILDWDKLYPWWRRPAQVRILIYADGSVHLQGGGFQGMQYVYQLLKSRAYTYVNFSVSFAHREGTDPTATIKGPKQLTDLDIINKFDEVWFFGFNGEPSLTPAELALLDTFMAAPKQGGVLVTGDHANLGRALSGQIRRAGKMRLYPAPDSVPPVWNTTLVEGPDAGATYDFNDQSDDTPQQIRYKRYIVGTRTGAILRTRPHPLLCGPDGPINVLPDHQHEGEALAPSPAPGDPDWPTKAGYQEHPEVIAWGRIKDPNALRHGQEIGVISAYDGHNVDVGRISADSTWHHWFDINLTGLEPTPSLPPYAGFDDTPAGRQVLKKLDAYFLNTGVWLAPPARQAEMRFAAWWPILWSSQIIELSRAVSITQLGAAAIDVLGRRTSRCMVSSFILDLPVIKSKIPKWEWPEWQEKLHLVDFPLEQFVGGGILRSLIKEFGPGARHAGFPVEPPNDEVLQRAIEAGAEEGLFELGRYYREDMKLMGELVERHLTGSQTNASEAEIVAAK
ncbi:hypothetical protein CIC12_31295 [Burkholderia sp. SG-MS1]|uniref:hypothetical protein n=1 Tax=Paraburkholderia sp. SG-MS1 TaxID=2023741 RepID=UPI001446C89C|nr:hypothetical protein [Paraburkholderia sp. SG-MS1]NKJ51128.1 hypothetical protein [Paraburkholderia sp. SG-MS1]